MMEIPAPSTSTKRHWAASISLCDDGVACTVDTCVLESDACEHTFKECASSEPCVLGWCAPDGDCETMPIEGCEADAHWIPIARWLGVQ